jgi:hypothetical protein
VLLSAACEEGREYAETVVGGMDKAKQMEVRASLQVLATALARHQMDHGRYPDRLSDLPEVSRGLSRTEDPWGQPLQYTTTGQEYQVVSSGPDQVPGNQDDVVLRDGWVE